MAYIEEANELMTDATGQSIATAIGNMSATSVGNLAALQTTDKTSLVGAVNEVKSGLIKSLTTNIELTTDADGNASSGSMSVLHPGKNILAVILNYNYLTSYSSYHATNIWYYPDNNTILIMNDELKSASITVFYTLLYTDT